MKDIINTVENPNSTLTKAGKNLGALSGRLCGEN